MHAHVRRAPRPKRIFSFLHKDLIERSDIFPSLFIFRNVQDDLIKLLFSNIEMFLEAKLVHQQFRLNLYYHKCESFNLQEKKILQSPNDTGLEVYCIFMTKCYLIPSSLGMVSHQPSVEPSNQP